MNKKISIITPVFADISGRTLSSVEGQSCRDFEWVIVRDNYCGIDYSNNYTSVSYKYIDLHANYGVSVARNVGIHVSTGDIILYLDSDDELAKDRVEMVIKYFTTYEHLALLFSGYFIKQGDGVAFYNPDKHSDIAAELQKGNVSIPLGVAHNRRLFYKAGGFQPGIVCGEDGILWRRMFQQFGYDDVFAISSYSAGIYHVNESGQSRTQRRYDMGGFAFDAGIADNKNGQNLDKEWYNSYSSRSFYEA